MSPPLTASCENLPSAGEGPDLSVVMVAMNEERTIGEALSAVKSIAHEIIVVDSGSTDNTKEIASKLGAQVVHRDWKGYADQKNFALDSASCGWVLNIDADEILSPYLVQEIKERLQPGAAKYVGFKLPRVLYIGGIPVRHGGFYPDAQLRLIRKGAGRFNDRLVHESISVDGPVLTFKHHMLHKAYANVEEFKAALDTYAQLSAQEFARQLTHKPADVLMSSRSRRQFNWWHTSYLNQWLHPVWTFFYRYILRAGFLDGALGLQLACIYSNYVAKKIRYLRRATR